MKRNTWLAAMAALVLLAGTGLLLSPTIHARWDAWRTGRAVQTFRGGVDRNLHLSDASASMETEPVGSTEEASVPYPELLQAMADYNKAICQNGQSDLCDPWVYQAPVFDLAEYGIADGVVGILSIPKMDNVKVPFQQIMSVWSGAFRAICPNLGAIATVGFVSV